MTEPATIHGRVIITWPAPNGQMVPGWGITATDADTGQQINDATRLTLDHGSPESWDTGPVYAVLTRFVGTDGEPSDAVSGRAPAISPTEEYAAYLKSSGDGGAAFTDQRYRTGEFRYLLAEMRVAPAAPAIPTRESVNRGEHTINQYREHHFPQSFIAASDDATEAETKEWRDAWAAAFAPAEAAQDGAAT